MSTERSISSHRTRFVTVALSLLPLLGCPVHEEALPFGLCKLYDAPALDAAIAKGLNVNAGCCDEHMIGECSVPRPNSTLLVHAIESKRADAVRVLLAHGADVNAPSSTGLPLGIAISMGQAEVVEQLLAKGVNDASRDQGLHMAAHAGQVDAGKRLITMQPAAQRGAACALLECSVVPELVQQGRPELPRQRELLLWAIQNCPDPNLKCEGDEHLFTQIARDDANAPLVEALLAKGADVNAPERNNRTVKEYLRHFNDYDSRPRIKALLEATH
ncbi:MAG: ankyrin repeat domain-containing protein [Deltaproteobacteria bacterium]|nr:ankyrin repeat domain-containing protein [Deltaproteobacteria bacterium]